MSTSPRVVRLVRPFPPKRDHHSKAKKQSTGVIHTTIRSSNSTLQSNINSSVSQNLSKCKQNKIYSINTIEIHRSDQTLPSSCSNPRKDNCARQKLSETNKDPKMGRTREDSSKASLVTPCRNKIVYYHDHTNITTSHISSDRMNLTDDYHRKRNDSKKKKTLYFDCCRCSCLCIIASLFTALLMVIAIIVICIAVLSPSKTASVKPTLTLRWKTIGRTVAGVVGQSGNGSNLLKYPWSLEIDPLYTLYIGDRQNNRIQKYLLSATSGTTIAGRADGILGSNATGLYFPGYIHVDSNGNIYIADSLNHRIQWWSRGTSVGVTVAGSSGNSLTQLSSPFGIARDPDTGTLYIADSNNHRIISYLSGASSGIVIAGNNGPGTNNTQLSTPRGVYFDSSTNSLVIDNRNANNIVRWVLGDTSWTLVAGSINGILGNSSELFQYPQDVIFDILGNMYVADDQNHRIQFFPSGQSKGITIAGVTNVLGNDSEHLYYPSSMRLDNQLNLYVVDQYNHRIQMFERY